MASKSVDIWVNVKGNAEKSIAKLNKSLKKTEGQTKKTAMGFKSIATAVGGLVVLKKAADWMKESTRLALEQEKAEKKLSAALGKTSQSLLDYASALQLKTTFGDEETIASMALVANFVKEEEQIKRITAAAQDMAEAKGMSLASATDLITKSVASSTNALTRYGVEIEGAAGSTERIDSAITNLTAAFGGMAEAASKTSVGQIKQMDNAIGDIREEVGEFLVPALLEWKQTQLQIYQFIGDNTPAIARSMQTLSGIIEDTVIVFDKVMERFNSVGGGTQAQADEKEIVRLLELRATAKVRIGQIDHDLYVIGLKNAKGIFQGKFSEAERIKLLEKRARFEILLGKTKDTLEKQAIKNIEEVTIKTDGLNTTIDETAKAVKGVGEESDFVAMNIDAWLNNIVAGAEGAVIASEADLERKRTNMQTTIDIASQTAQAVQAVMSSVNTRKQQEHDNDVQRQKDDVRQSSMSAKQKANAMAKIDAAASKERLKLRLSEWRQAIVMSIVNTALGVTASAPVIPKMIAVGALGLVQTGIIAGNKPKAYNGMVLDNQSGMTGDVIPIMARKGEEVLSPSDPRNVKNGGGNGQSLSVGGNTMNFYGTQDESVVEKVKAVMENSHTMIEEMFTTGKINPNLVNEALAV